MPHTVPAAFVENSAVHPAVPTSDGVGYTTGDAIPASINDTSAPHSAAHTPPVHAEGHTFAEGHAANIAHHLADSSSTNASSERFSRSGSRTRDFVERVSRSISRDPFFHRGGDVPQEEEQRQAALSEVHAAQASTAAGVADREARSKSRTREFIRSASRSLSRDPFFHRGTPEGQDEAIRATALSQTKHALEAHKAGVADEEARSHSREGRTSQQGSPAGSRSGSRARGFLKSALGVGESTEHVPRGAAGLGETKE